MKRMVWNAAFLAKLGKHGTGKYNIVNFYRAMVGVSVSDINDSVLIGRGCEYRPAFTSTTKAAGFARMGKFGGKYSLLSKFDRICIIRKIDAMMKKYRPNVNRESIADDSDCNILIS